MKWSVHSQGAKPFSANLPLQVRSAFTAKSSRPLDTLDISLFCLALTHSLMEDPGGLAGLQGLHCDLLALEASRLVNVERLWADLEARVNEFRQLLDKPAKNETSRKALSSGKVSRSSVRTQKH